MNIDIDDRLIYLAAGCGVGLILGLLFAPESGEEMRQDLSNTVGDLTHKVQSSVIEKGKNVAQFGRQRLNESMEAGKRKYSELMEE
jgi:gas vesicle protein